MSLKGELNSVIGATRYRARRFTETTPNRLLSFRFQIELLCALDLYQ